jgi:hypothetical protein
VSKSEKEFAFTFLSDIESSRRPPWGNSSAKAIDTGTAAKALSYNAQYMHIYKIISPDWDFSTGCN